MNLDAYVGKSFRGGEGDFHVWVRRAVKGGCQSVALYMPVTVPTILLAPNDIQGSWE